jgi:hypothetical protein
VLAPDNRSASKSGKELNDVPTGCPGILSFESMSSTGTESADSFDTW